LTKGVIGAILRLEEIEDKTLNDIERWHGVTDEREEGFEIIPGRLYNTEEIAAWLGVAKRTVWRLLRSGAIKSFKVGRGKGYRVLGEELLRWARETRGDTTREETERQGS